MSVHVIHSIPAWWQFLTKSKSATPPLLASLMVFGSAFAQVPDSKSVTTTPTTITNKVDVGGYKLQYASYGQGSPTVIVEAGLGEPAVESGSWKAVIEEIATTTRIVVYNRAGLATSEAAPTLPRTSKDVAKDLRALLTNAKITGPYILVGHSMGGLHLRVYAKDYPQDIGGIILVDATHPDQFTQWLAALPPQSADEPPSITSARAFLTEQTTSMANNPERLDIKTSGDQARAAGTFGDKPLIVLTHSPKWRMVPDLSDEVLAKLEDVSQRLQVELTKLSTKSTHTIAEKAGHYIQVEEPQLVIDAILKLVKQARDQKSQ